MNFSRLRHKIIILKPVQDGENSMSESVVKWYPYNPAAHNVGRDIYVSADCMIYGDEEAAAMTEYGIRANVSPTTGREYEEAQKIRAETTYKVTIRYFDDIAANMKILYRGRVFNIVSVLDIGEMHREIQLICEEADRYGKV